MYEPTAEAKKLLKHYKQAAKEIVLIIKRTESAYFKKERIRRLKEILKILKTLDARSKRWADLHIPKAYRFGAGEMVKFMTDFEEREFKILAFTGIPKEAVTAIAQEASESFGAGVEGVFRHTKKIMNRLQRAALQDKIVSGVIRGSASEAVKKEILEELGRFGVTSFRSLTGRRRRFSLTDYADILVRSSTAKAYNDGAVNRLITSGRRFAVVDVIRPDLDEIDICNKWEKKLVDLTKAQVPSAGNKDPKVAKPPFHPRCRHTLLPISFAQIKKRFPKQYKEAVEFYEKKAK